ncbi:hypothetical protein RFI_00596 [Reticulomyxa filosa]|uniref:Uncharacterized protein n=1 Tax=Reticulomyxa filosa TaxID=46433 RepID=X6PE34_RETFI|nr:hypothetical protein RFI_00596 [Reticulomyxa filosa]|eukprot:ETO36466.1 hypothetical protein RFI_00596 [Reticulomyxa filosa]
MILTKNNLCLIYLFLFSFDSKISKIIIIIIKYKTNKNYVFIYLYIKAKSKKLKMQNRLLRYKNILKSRKKNHTNIIKNFKKSIKKLKQEIEFIIIDKSENIKKNQENYNVKFPTKMEINNGQSIKVFKRHTGVVYSIDYHSFDNSTFICSGSNDKTFRSRYYNSFLGYSIKKGDRDNDNDDKDDNEIRCLTFKSKKGIRYLICTISTTIGLIYFKSTFGWTQLISIQIHTYLDLVIKKTKCSGILKAHQSK